MEDSLSAVLQALVRAGAAVRVGDGGRLVLEAPPGAIDVVLRDAVIAHREAIIEHVRRERIPDRLDTLTVSCLETGRAPKACVFCFHGFQGTVGMYRPLASALAVRADVFGVQAVGVDLKSEPLSSLESMAEYYASQVSLFSGRVVFVGWCVGAALALETARRLRNSGRPVAGVVCADPWLGQLASDSQRWHSFLEIYLSERTASEAAAESLGLSDNDRLRWLAQQRRTLRPHIGVENDMATLRRRLDFWASMDASLGLYRYVPHRESVALYLSEAYAHEQADALRGYGSSPGEILAGMLPDAPAFEDLGRRMLAKLG